MGDLAMVSSRLTSLAERAYSLCMQTRLQAPHQIWQAGLRSPDQPGSWPVKGSALESMPLALKH